MLKKIKEWGFWCLVLTFSLFIFGVVLMFAASYKIEQREKAEFMEIHEKNISFYESGRFEL